MNIAYNLASHGVDTYVVIRNMTQLTTDQGWDEEIYKFHCAGL
jgi:hypothetical protein